MNNSQTNYLFGILGIVLLTMMVSCKDDDPLSPEELIAQDPQAAWRTCGTAGWFQRDEPGGECIRCNTEAGYIQSGRDGQICYKPGFNYQYFRMVLFDTLPNAWWPSDTLYLANIARSEEDATFNSFGTGQISTLGFSLEDTWIPPGCPPEDADRQSTYAKLGPSYSNLRTSSNRPGFYNDETFEFVIQFADVNNDCLADVGYVEGFTERDTSFAIVNWVNIRGPQEQRGDTVHTAEFIMVQPPAWLNSAW